MSHRLSIIILVISATALGRAQNDRSLSATGAVFIIDDFGARGDGQTLNTLSIQNAIDTAFRRGGGTVVVPNGRYVTGTLVLKSNTTLHLQSGAVLLGSRNLSDYIPLKFRPEAEERIPNKTKGEDFGWLHLIYAQGGRNIAITGRGSIDGNGHSFWNDAYLPLERPHQLIQFEGCEDVSVDGITIRNAPFWALHMLGSKRIRIDAITIVNDRRGPNTDGIDINSSSEVTISNCFIDTGDDALCFKSMFEDQPVENVTVSNCILSSDDSAIKLGTRSSADIRNLVVSNCVIRRSTYGISLFMKDGGTYRDLLFANITIETSDDVGRTRAVFPLFMDVERRGQDSKLGKIRGVHFNNITIVTTGHSLFNGTAESAIEDLSFRDIHVRVVRPDRIKDVRKPRGVSGLPVAEVDFASVSSHFTFAHVNGLSMRDVRIEVDQQLTGLSRHGLWITSGADIRVDGFSLSEPSTGEAMAVVHCIDSKDVFLTGAWAMPGTEVFLALRGRLTNNVTVMGSDFSRATKAFDISPDVPWDQFHQSINKLP